MLDGRKRGIPIFASIPEALRALLGATPDFCVVGVATSGGRVTPGLRGLLAEAISLGMSVVNGLHEFVSDDPELVAAAAAKGVSITDVRKTAQRTDLHFWSGDIGEVRAPRIAVLGTDCALGKRTTARFLMEACRRAGLRTELIFTGQTGWMQGAPYGFIFDSIPNDFVSGELEHAVVSCWRQREARPHPLRGTVRAPKPVRAVRLRVPPLRGGEGRHPAARAGPRSSTRASRSSGTGSPRSPTRSR